MYIYRNTSDVLLCYLKYWENWLVTPLEVESLFRIIKYTDLGARRNLVEKSESVQVPE